MNSGSDAVHNRKGVKIGVLSLQGDVAENVSAVSAALKSPRGFDDDSIVSVKTPRDVSDLDGLVMPGGESTAIGILADANGTLDAIKSRIRDEKMPVLGICAGLIMLAKSVGGPAATGDDTAVKQPYSLLGALDVTIRRNAFGRQRQSFETKLNLHPLSITDFKGVFIRAPLVSSVGSGVDVLCELDASHTGSDQGKRRIVAVCQENVIGTAFHPELSGDLAIHRHFVDAVRRKKRGQSV